MTDERFTLPEIKEATRNCLFRFASGYEFKTSSGSKLSEEDFVKLCGAISGYIADSLELHLMHCRQ